MRPAMAPGSPWCATLDEAGFVSIPETIAPAERDVLAAAADALLAGDQPGNRNGLEDPTVHALAIGPVRHLVSAMLGADAFAVRATVFDKHPGANWPVAWHRDRTIPVRARHDVPGFGPWSEKDGIPHVQPPDSLLATMLAVRVHLDAATTENGALCVIPGSHRQPRPAPTMAPVTCAVPEGGLLLMRPLLLHASHRSRSQGHRRVIHLEYAAGDLPGGLEWHRRCR